MRGAAGAAGAGARLCAATKHLACSFENTIVFFCVNFVNMNRIFRHPSLVARDVTNTGCVGAAPRPILRRDTAPRCKPCEAPAGSIVRDAALRYLNCLSTFERGSWHVDIFYT